MIELKKLLGWLSALLVTVVVGDRLLSALLMRPLLASQFRFSRLYRGGNDADVLILGDSRAVTALSPRLIQSSSGWRTMSLGYNGMPLPITEALLADYLDGNRAPRLVIVEITSAAEPMNFTSEVKTYARFSPRLAALYAKEHPVAAPASQMFRLFLFNSECFLRALYYLRQSDQDWSNSGTISTFMLQSVRFAKPWSLQPSAGSLDALERMIRELRSRRIEVRLIIGPYLPQYLAHGDLDSFIASVVGRTSRVDSTLTVWNYAAAVPDAASFADPVHLNRHGAEGLIPRLQRDGFFTPGAVPSRPSLESPIGVAAR